MPTNKSKIKFIEGNANLKPLEASASSTTPATKSRRNKVAFNQFIDRFPNIENGFVPFRKCNKSNLSIKEIVELVQKAYYNFSILRNTIDLMTEFATSEIYYEGGTKKARDFYSGIFDSSFLWRLQDQFFREYFRSGNVFLYKIIGSLGLEDLEKLNSNLRIQVKSLKLPIKYLLLNPSDIQTEAGLTFSNNQYYKLLNSYEVEILRNPRTERDRLMLESLPDEVKRQIKSKSRNLEVLLPLKNEEIVITFYKKQDYEPFAVPMAFPVLDDIEYKMALKKMDIATMRHMQQAILLITMGLETKDGELYIDQKQKEVMQGIFENESVGRVLIADFTTKAQFVIPDIAAILDPKKYEVVDKDIREGLNSILTGNEKFANQATKVEIFLERLKQAREAFLNDFLIPEMESIGKQMNFRSIPSPKFIDMEFKDKIQFQRVQTRLMELGILTPDEGLDAMKTGRLPDKEASIENQKEYQEFKNQGLYEPLVGGSRSSSSSPGRPEGTDGVPQETKNITPMGLGKKYSLSKIKENMALAYELDLAIKDKLKQIHNIKRFTKKQYEIMDEISKVIIANEEPKKWKKNIEKYIKEPVDHNPKRASITEDIAAEHGVDIYTAGILAASLKDA